MRPVDRLGPTVLLATTNPSKIVEIRAILDLSPVELVGLERFPALEAPEETGRTFLENAALKAHYYSHETGLPCLAEDSGLEIDALRKAPGVHTARFMGVTTPYPARMRHILLLLTEVPDERRTARYRSAVVVAWPDGTQVSAEGTIEGRIADDLRGQGGFGYDPIFLVPELDGTFGELPADVKNRMSHRGQALQHLMGALSTDRVEAQDNTARR